MEEPQPAVLNEGHESTASGGVRDAVCVVAGQLRELFCRAREHEEVVRSRAVGDEVNVLSLPHGEAII